MPTQEEWRAILERRLPPKSTYIARSRAITGLYAHWYLKEPWLFKWAGMAAFASAQVGHSLALVEMLQAPYGAIREIDPAQQADLLDLLGAIYGRGLNLALMIPLMLHDAATRPLLLNDLELVKQANDAIFDDIGWAHVAYATEGLPAVLPNLSADRQPLLVEAFRMLDEGARRLCEPSGYAEGSRLIQQSALTMLRHEQQTVLPPYFERMSNTGKILASFGAALNFEGSPTLAGQPSFSGYYGPLAVLAGTRSVASTTDRWAWIEGQLLPIWSRVDAAYGDGCALQRELAALAYGAPTVLQRTAGLMNFVYPALGLKVGAPTGGQPAPVPATA